MRAIINILNRLYTFIRVQECYKRYLLISLLLHYQIRFNLINDSLLNR